MTNILHSDVVLNRVMYAKIDPRSLLQSWHIMAHLNGYWRLGDTGLAREKSWG